ncbi:hypothetical protein HELRODRAFT_64779, partial [Helobdella robusta]|uniref:Uncharacterized protein n=1 Tax=Helobdella robusta TaxID=6412 RepID=T1FXZ2_HELRO
VRQRIIFKPAVLTYKLLNTSQPSYLHQLISRRSSTRQLRSSSYTQLHQPGSNSSAVNKCFTYSSPSI